MPVYSATTEDITILVQPVYLDGHSSFIEHRFVFGYFIRIENNGSGEVQLLKRRWIITDAEGNVEKVEGDGVVGQQPVIGPGESHEYNSFAVLKTFEGHMEGDYLMQRENGERFRTQIPRFTLRAAAN